MIDTNAIRQKVIDSAIEGRLINFDNSYCAISEIKEKMLTNGFNVITDITDEDKWCSLPENWTWTCLENITNSEYLNDGDWVLKKDMVDEGPVKLIQLGSIGKCFFKEKEHKKLTKEHFEELNGTQIFPGYMLINRLVTDGMKACIIPKMDGILMTAVDVCWIKPNEEMYSLKYLMYALTSTGIQSLVNQLGHGVTRFRISKLNLIKIPIPYPPRVVQEEIVNRIDEIFSILNTIDVLQTRYALDNEVLKNKLIDAGIQGKLTEQLPEDGTADDLLKQIKKEKQLLIKEKKIKAMKSLPEITEDEIPFNIPNNWKFVRLGEVLNEIIVPQRDKPKVFDGDIPWCRIEDAEGMYLRRSLSNQNVSQATVDEMNLRVCPKGTILSACSGASIGRILITESELCTNQTFNGLVCSSGLYNKYLFYYMNHMIDKLRKMGTGAAMAYISQDKTAKMVIPFPPYNEQVRIADKIDRIMAMI